MFSLLVERNTFTHEHLKQIKFLNVFQSEVSCRPLSHLHLRRLQLEYITDLGLSVDYMLHLWADMFQTVFFCTIFSMIIYSVGLVFSKP